MIFLDFKMTGLVFIYSLGKEGKKLSAAFPLSRILAVTFPTGWPYEGGHSFTSSAFLSLVSLSYCITHTEYWIFLCKYCNMTLTKEKSNSELFPSRIQLADILMHCITIPPCSFLEDASSGFGLKRISLLFYQKSRNNPTYHFSCSLLATFTGTNPI